jgi:uncharacterized protein (DUF1697 family)
MARTVALLRGINVGGNKKVPMARLREVIGELGYSDIKTYVNSGNVVFGGRKASQRRIEDALEAEFGWRIPVVLRTREELAAVIDANPLGAQATNLSRYLVSFSGSAQPLDASRMDGVEPGRNEAYEIVGREAYLWLPDGVHSSPLAKAVTDRRFGVVLTARNWRTVEKLYAMTGDV